MFPLSNLSNRPIGFSKRNECANTLWERGNLRRETMEPLGGHQLDASAGKGSRKKIFALIGCAVIFPIILTV